MAHLDLRLLLALDALLRHRHLTRAGDSLGLSQPVMSKYLRRLRAVMRDPPVRPARRPGWFRRRAKGLAEPLAEGARADAVAAAARAESIRRRAVASSYCSPRISGPRSPAGAARRTPRGRAGRAPAAALTRRRLRRAARERRRRPLGRARGPRSRRRSIRVSSTRIRSCSSCAADTPPRSAVSPQRVSPTLSTSWWHRGRGPQRCRDRDSRARTRSAHRAAAARIRGGSQRHRCERRDRHAAEARRGRDRAGWRVRRGRTAVRASDGHRACSHGIGVPTPIPPTAGCARRSKASSRARRCAAEPQGFCVCWPIAPRLAEEPLRLT